MVHVKKKHLQFQKNYVIILFEHRFGTIVRINLHKEYLTMEPCTYFIIAIILLLTSFGAISHTAAIATFTVSAIMLMGGLYTKFLLK